MKEKVLMAASVASMIDQFNMPNIRLLQQMGYEVHVVCNFHKGNTCDWKRLQKFKQMLSEWHVLWHQWDCPRDVRDVRSCQRAYRQLQKLLRLHCFAWVHCHSPVGGMLVRIAAHRAGISVIYTAHGFHFYQGASLWKWALYFPAEKLLSYWTDILITVNREDYRFAKRYLNAGKTVYIPGVGIDTKKFGTYVKHGRTGGIYEKYKIPKSAIILLSVGELSRRKNHEIVISALAELGRQDLYYMICGQGAYRKRLMHDARKLGVAEYVRLAGFQENMPDLYRYADLFVFPSLQEGLPAALMEAMAAGLPCAASDIRGNRELIDSQGGILFAPQEQERLVSALELLAGDPVLRETYGAYNKNKVKMYDIALVNRKMQKIYEAMGSVI